MHDVVFTFEWYRSLLDRLRSNGYRCRSYGEGVASNDVLLRHDVDLSPERAYTLARMEHDRGITSTYFFLVGSPLYNPFQDSVREVIEGISSLGHDVGLHFSTHQYWPATHPPEERDLADAVHLERKVLRAIAPDVVSTVSFHLPPPWVLERTFESFPSTYEPRFFDEIDYVADSGQRWRDEGVSIPDDGQPLQVLVHPGLWSREDGSFVERIRESVVEADRRADQYVQSRYLEPDQIRSPKTAPTEPPEA